MKKRRRRYRKRRSSEGSENWIQCEDCKKWRRLPVDRSLQWNKTEKWSCHMNDWDRGRANCLCPEEVRFSFFTLNSLLYLSQVKEYNITFFI